MRTRWWAMVRAVAAVALGVATLAASVGGDCDAFMCGTNHNQALVAIDGMGHNHNQVLA